MSYLKNITGKIPNTGTQLNIPIRGKSLIITGRNGSGKTYFLNQLHTSIQQANNPYNNYNFITTEIERLEKNVQYNGNDKHLVQHLASLKSSKELLESGIIIDTRDPAGTQSDGGFLILSFQAMRSSNIAKPSHMAGIKSSSGQYSQLSSQPHPTVGDTLEQHLVNLEARRAMMAAYPNDELSAKIDHFLAQLQANIKLLMEDSSAELVFDIDETKIAIKRASRPDTSFQTLSSGYSAFFSYYSELILRAEYKNIAPQDLKGVVFIDELEVHLHVSLQRLILPFLIQSFPKIQFIITTHSPFVITSSNDVVIYDISSNSIIDEDITFYSYTSIVEGLLGAKSKSIALDDTVKKIVEAIKNRDFEVNHVKPLLEKLEHSLENLDNKSKVVYEIGLNAVQDKEQKDV